MTGDSRWQIVHGELMGIAKRRAALDADEARWLREAEAIRIWKQLGMVSMIDYLERTLGYAPKTGADRMRVARALGNLPELTEALTNGELAFSAVRELVRVVVPETEGQWRQAARDKNLREIESLVAGHTPGDLPDDPPDPQVRTYTVAFEEVDAATFALARQARQILDGEHGTRMSDTQVLAVLCAGIIDGAASAEHTGRAKNQIAYVVCEVCDRALQEGAGVHVPVDAATLAQARCDAQHIGSLDAATPARAVQDIPPAVARLVWRRDRGVCQTPGCRSSRCLEIHHIVARADGGTHDPWNLTLRCGSCHRAHHEGRLAISGTAPDALVTTRVNAIAHTAPATPTTSNQITSSPMPSITSSPVPSVTSSPITSSPVTSSSVTSSPVTSSSVTSSPVTSSPVTSSPVTSSPVTSSRAKSKPVTSSATMTHIATVQTQPPVPTSSPSYAKVVARTQIIAVLRTAGWRSDIARKAADEAVAHVGATASLEHLVREAFRRCPRPTS